MLRAVTALTFSIVLAAHAEAEPIAAHPQPTPSAMSLAAPSTAAAATSSAASERPSPLSVLDDPAWEKVKAQQDAFDRRISEKSRRVARSICTGCDALTAQVRGKAARRKEATANAGDDYVVDEPDSAPIE